MSNFEVNMKNKLSNARFRADQSNYSLSSEVCFWGLEKFFFLFAQIHALKIWWKILVCYQIPWHRHAGSEVGKNVSSNNFKLCDTNRKFRLKILYYKMLSDFKNICDPFHFCPAWSILKIFFKSKMFVKFSANLKKNSWRYILF